MRRRRARQPSRALVLGGRCGSRAAAVQRGVGEETPTMSETNTDDEMHCVLCGEDLTTDLELDTGVCDACADVEVPA